MATSTTIECPKCHSQLALAVVPLSPAVAAPALPAAPEPVAVAAPALPAPVATVAAQVATAAVKAVAQDAFAALMDSAGKAARLTTNFSVREVSKSNDAERNNIDNRLPAALLPAAKMVAERILEPARAHFSQLAGHPVAISPNSWYRSFALEKFVCRNTIAELREDAKAAGKDPDAAEAAYLARKQHPKGCAVDFEISTVSNYELALWLSKNVKFDQLILEMYRPGDPHSGWVHCSVAPDGKDRGMVLTITPDNKTLTGLRQ